MKGFNLTEWAIRHKALSIYFMLVCLVAGVLAYLHLGRNEDPEFTVKTMVVQTLWPGATQEETMQQVTDRIEKKLQELAAESRRQLEDIFNEDVRQKSA